MNVASRSPLTFVRPGGPVESATDRAKRLQRELRAAEMERVAEMEASLAEAMRHCEAVAEGSFAIPAGVRDLARRLAEYLRQQAATVASIREKS